MLMGAEAFGREILSPSVERVSISLPKMRGSFRLVQISDLHYRGGYTPCESLAGKIEALNPDAVCITGDVLSDRSSLDQLTRLLESLSAPVYVVPGNWEHYLQWNTSSQEAFYKKTGAEFLLNRTTRCALGGGVNIAGIDDPFTGRDDLDKALKGTDPSRPTILLSHAPLIAPQAARRAIDLTLCGHTHGGQIRLPFFGAVLIPPGSNGFQMGMYDVEGMKLYVNRGIGTCLVPMRFLCPPEITLFRIAGKEN